MRRRIFTALILLSLVMFTMGAGSKTDEMKRMGIYISNFTEQRMYDFDMEEDGDDDLVHLGDPENVYSLRLFGIIHNIINNPKSTLKICPDRKCPYGKHIMSGQAVTASVMRYFGVSIKNGQLPEGNDGWCVHYDGKNYHFTADIITEHLDTVYYAEVQNVSRMGGIITMSGELYNVKDKKDRPATFIAAAKPHVWNDKATWAILSLRTEWR